MKRISDKKLIIAFTVAFILVHLFYFPSFYASGDEREYLKNAFLLMRGTLSEPELTQVCTGQFNGHGYVSHFFIGRSIFLIPFALLSFPVIMASGLIIHLLNLVIFYFLLKKLNYSPLYSLLYLLYPAFYWEARTLNSEILVLSGILMGLYFYLSEKKRDHILSGVFFGLSCFARYESLLLVSSFFLVPLIRNRKKFFFSFMGILPVLLLLLFLNNSLYGSAISTGYGSPLAQFDIGKNPHFFENIGKFILLLSIAYPLMFFSPLAKSRIRWEALLAMIIFLVFYSENASIAVFSTFHPTAFTGQLRYIVPLIGLLLLAYPPLLEKIFSSLRLPKKPAILAMSTALFAVFIFASSVHASFLEGRYAVYNQIYSHTTKGSLLIGSADDCNYVMNEVFEERSYLSVKTEELGSFIKNYENVYVLDISYSTVDPSTERGAVALAERQAIKDFIQRTPSLEKIFSSSSPHHVEIYRLK